MKAKMWRHLYSGDSLLNSIEEVLQIIYKNRLLTDTTSIESFLKPNIQSINYNIGDMDAVIKRLQRAIESKEKIIVYGDYDADGITASAIMWEGLYALGANVKPYIPHREKEGYGLSIYGIDNLIETEKVELIITVDQGISGRKQVEYAQSKGVEIIVTDHHTAPAILPQNCLIVHDSKVSGAAVAWKVVTELLRKVEGIPQTELPQLSEELLELVAIGIVCDLVPLHQEARTLVYYGLEQLRKTKRPGLLALAKQAAFEPKDIQTYHIGYLIGPRINAMGRLEHAIDSLRLLCTRNQQKAEELAQKVNLVNTDRKELTFNLINQAKKQAEEQINDKLLIIGDPTWNPGIIGLIASGLVEEFYKPTIVWGSSADHPDIYKASCRSIKGFNIINAISLHADSLIAHGGHPMAAGFSVHPTELPQFKENMQTYAKETLLPNLLTPSLDIDCALPMSLVNENLYQAIQKLKPFGMQCEEPLFASEQLEVIECKTLGSENKHLKMKVASTPKSYHPFEAIAFGQGSLSSTIRPGQAVSLAYHVDLNEWNGNKKIQLKVRDIKLA